MPWLSSHPCRHQGCGVLIRGPSGHCEEHRGEARKRQDEARPSAARRGYDAGHRRRRAAFLADHLTCMRPGCGVESTVLDHKIPLSQGGADDESNWQALCEACHNSWKQRQDRARRRALQGG